MAISVTPGKWGAALVVPPDFLAYSVDRGELLAYAATRVIALINARTDKGLDVNGSPFPPHARSVVLTREDGLIKRGERGRWTENELARRPVDLRGLDDVPMERRMRANLRFSPAHPRPDQRTVWVMPQGSRERPMVAIGPRDAGGRPPHAMQSIPHNQVAKWNQNGHPINGIDGKGRPYTSRVPARPWIGLSSADRDALARELREPPPVSWLKKRNEAAKAMYQKRADSARRRIASAKKRGDDAAAARAEAKHRVYVDELTRIGGQYTEKAPAKRGRKPRAAG